MGVANDYSKRGAGLVSGHPIRALRVALDKGPARTRLPLPAPRIFLLLMVAVMLIASPGVTAHHAPSGMEYDQGCCNSYNGTTGDCIPVDANQIQDNGDDSYTVVASGERFTSPFKDGSEESWIVVSLDPRRTLKKNGHWKMSQDGQYHRCFFDIHQPTNGTRCLYVPRPGV